MPLRRMECVCPPHTSMIFQGRVARQWISRAMRCATSPLRNSVRYFTSRGNLRSLPTRRLSLAAAIGARGLRSFGGSAKSFFLAGQFFLQHAHFAERLEGLLRALLVDAGDRKPHVDNGIVAHFDLRQALQAYVLHHSAKVHAAHPHRPIGGDRFYPAWNGETHGTLLIRLPIHSKSDLDHLRLGPSPISIPGSSGRWPESSLRSLPTP